MSVRRQRFESLDADSVRHTQETKYGVNRAKKSTQKQPKPEHLLHSLTPYSFNSSVSRETSPRPTTDSCSSVVKEEQLNVGSYGQARPTHDVVHKVIHSDIHRAMHRLSLVSEPS